MSYSDKYSTHKSIGSNYSPYKRGIEQDSDLYSPFVVEDLLSGVHDWKNIQEIVRLTFKALTDVVKAQGETLRELEKQLPLKASKTELSSGLSLKANISDISRTISEVTSSLETKLTYDECQSMLRDYVLKSDFQYSMSTKASVEEVKSFLESRVSTHELKQEINSLYDKFDDWYSEINRKLSSFAHQRELENVKSLLDMKANIDYVNEGLESRATKQSVNSSLQRKANKSDVEAMLLQKADAADIDNLLNALDSKVDYGALEKIQKQLDDKIERADYNYLASTLATKAERSDIEFLANAFEGLKAESDQNLNEFDKRFELLNHQVDTAVENLQSQLTKKADLKELDRVVGVLSKKADLDAVENTLNQIRQETAQQLDEAREELVTMKRQVEEAGDERDRKIEGFYDKLSEEIYRVNDQMTGILEDRRKDMEETGQLVKQMAANLKKETQSQSNKIDEELGNFKKILEEGLSKKLDKKEFLETKAKILSELDGKVDVAEVQKALNQCQEDISNQFAEYKEDVSALIQEHENEMLKSISKKANSADVASALSAKADTALVQQILDKKVGDEDFDALRKDIENALVEVEQKVTRNRESDFAVNQIKRQLEDFQKDILLKANIKDVCALLDAKPNIDDVNKALVEIHKELDQKTNQDEFRNVLNDQSLINETICTENIVGRWAWKSGDLKAGLVPWEVQLSNTLPDNFIWEKEKSTIIAMSPGLYEITFGFFAKKKPTVQILINGEPILSAVNTSSYVIHHSSGKMKDVNLNKPSFGNVTGLTMIDFIVLPAKAKITIAYTGDQGAEGFLGLKRL